MKNTIIAVDLAKNVFEIAISDRPGQVRDRRRLSRAQFLRFFANVEPSTVLLEACGSSHHWGRRIRELGHNVVLLPPHLVVPYRRGNKHDRADTKALLEAHRNEDIPPVPIKTLEQHTLTALHRLRSAWVATRTARYNALRGLLRELGVFIPVGAKHVLPRLSELLEDAESSIPDALRHSLFQACEEIRHLTAQIAQVERQLEALSKQVPEVQRLRTIPGIGLLTSTAIVGFVGELQRFRSARHFSSFLGLVPKENSSGNVRRLGRITKRGDVYIRTLMTHGARSVLLKAHANKHPDRLRAWALGVHNRRGHNKATIALANKIARIVWAISTRHTTYESAPEVA